MCISILLPCTMKSVNCASPFFTLHNSIITLCTSIIVLWNFIIINCSPTIILPSYIPPYLPFIYSVFPCIPLSIIQYKILHYVFCIRPSTMYSVSDPTLCILYQTLHYVSSVRPYTMYPVSDPTLYILYQTLHYVFCIRSSTMYSVSDPYTMYPESDPPLYILYQTLHYVSNQLEFLSVLLLWKGRLARRRWMGFSSSHTNLGRRGVV